MIYKIRGEIFFDEFFLKKKIKGGEIRNINYSPISLLREISKRWSLLLRY
jgi:hypothetical protein